MRKPKLRGVIYIRLSEHKGEDDPSTSPDRQREACIAYCKSQDWEIVEIVDSDLDFSGFIHGKRLERPGIKRVIELLDDIDRVVFLKVDRLVRSVSDFTKFADICDERGAALVSVQEGFDLGTPFGRLIAVILAAFAEMESRTISQRVTDAKAFLKAAGRWAGGTPPRGYVAIKNPDGVGYVLVIDTDVAEQIRWAAEQLIAERETMYSIAQKWSLLRADGKGTSASTARRIILSDAVTGRQPWPAILDPVSVRKLRRLYPEKPGVVRAKRGSRLLSGLLQCSGCEGRLHVGPAGTAGKIAYSCARPSCTRKVGINADAADRLITDFFLDRFGQDQRVVQVEELLDDGRAEEAIQAAILETTDAMAQGGDLGLLVPRLQALRGDLAAVQAAPTRVRQKLVLGDLVALEWAEADLQEQRALLRGEIEQIIVLPTTRGIRPSMARFDIVERQHSLPDD